MAETNSLAEQTPEELAEAQYHTTLRGFGVFIFPQVSATQMKECGACRRKCRPAEFDYKVTPIRFGSFGEGAVITFCDKCYAPFKVALSALTTTAQERDTLRQAIGKLNLPSLETLDALDDDRFTGQRPFTLSVSIAELRLLRATLTKEGMK